MNNQISVCGVDCSSAPCFGEMCAGCNAVEGKTFWAKDHLPTGVCTIYDCVKVQKGYNNCGECADLPCDIYFALKDPSMTEEEHKAGIERRVSLLRNL